MRLARPFFVISWPAARLALSFRYPFVTGPPTPTTQTYFRELREEGEELEFEFEF